MYGNNSGSAGVKMSKSYIKRRKLKEVERMAKEHADWFVEMIRPMLKEVAKTFFIHGYEHRRKEESKSEYLRRHEGT